VFENYTTEVHLNNRKYVLMLFDTAGQEDYDRLRPLSYDQADVIIICYDVTCPSSIENVEIRWIPEIHHFCPNAPIILVGCKTDLRNEEKTDNLCSRVRDSRNFVEEKKTDPATDIFVSTLEVKFYFIFSHLIFSTNHYGVAIISLLWKNKLLKKAVYWLYSLYSLIVFKRTVL